MSCSVWNKSFTADGPWFRDHAIYLILHAILAWVHTRNDHRRYFVKPQFDVESEHRRSCFEVCLDSFCLCTAQTPLYQFPCYSSSLVCRVCGEYG